jgi:TRAP-type C4-dicarboxylate transport system permease small subunit
VTISAPPVEPGQTKLASVIAGKVEAELAPHAAPRSAWTRFEELLVGGLALAALLVCSYNVFVRYFIHGLTLEAADEVQVYLVIWAVFLALGLVTAADRHVRADLFVAMFAPGFRRWVSIFGELLGLAFALLLLGYGTAVTWQTWSYGDLSTTSLRFPLWIYGAALPVGALLMAVAYAKRCLKLFRKEKA